jgi:hypothetical protein
MAGTGNHGDRRLAKRNVVGPSVTLRNRARVANERLPNGKRIVCARYPGYLRGISIFEGGALVGVSRERHRPRIPGTGTVNDRPFGDQCGVIRFNQNWEPMDFVDLSWVGPEIFDIALTLPGISAPTTQETVATATRRIAPFVAAWRARC